MCVRAKGLEGVDVCLLSEEVCNSVWQWVIDSENQSQTLLRKHKACMPGHIPVCLFIRLSGLYVDQYDTPEQKDYDWIVGRHQHLSWSYTSPNSNFFANYLKLYQTLIILILKQQCSKCFTWAWKRLSLIGQHSWLWNSQFSDVAQLSDNLINR